MTHAPNGRQDTYDVLRARMFVRTGHSEAPGQKEVKTGA